MVQITLSGRHMTMLANLSVEVVVATCRNWKIVVPEPARPKNLYS